MEGKEKAGTARKDQDRAQLKRITQEEEGQRGRQAMTKEEGGEDQEAGAAREGQIRRPLLSLVA